MKKCRRVTDGKLFAVKEVRCNINDDFDKQCLENQILLRLNLAEHPNIVSQEAFFKDPSKQTTQLVMQALNGMTLQDMLLSSLDNDSDSDSIDPEKCVAGD